LHAGRLLCRNAASPRRRWCKPVVFVFPNQVGAGSRALTSACGGTALPIVRVIPASDDSRRQIMAFIAKPAEFDRHFRERYPVSAGTLVVIGGLMEWSTKPRLPDQPFGSWADDLAAAFVRLEPRRIADQPFEGAISRVEAAPIQISLVTATSH